jgi:DNA topoisomerase-3
MHEVMPNYIAAMANNLSSATQLTDPEKTLYAKAFQMTDPAKKSKIWKAGIADGESHHAIIPTDEKRSLTDLTPDEFIVYRELCDRLIVQFLPDYEYSNTTVITDVGGVPCRTSGNTPRRMGWKALSKEEKEESDEDEDAGVLPPMELGQTNAVAKSETKESTTTEPKHYTEDELLGDLEKPNKFVNNKKVLKRIKKLQIGTGGTRQNHINQLLIKEFVSHVKEKKGRKTIIRLVPTQKLLGLSSISPDYFKHPETSAFWEEAFIKIQKGEQTYAEFMDVQTKLLKRFFLELNDGAFRLTEPILANYKRCEDPCGGYIFLKKLPKKKFDLWCCSKCDAAYIDEKGQLGTKLGSGGGSNKPIRNG